MASTARRLNEFHGEWVEDSPVRAVRPAGHLRPNHFGPVLAGRKVGLRPLGPGDYEILREVELSDELIWRWRHEGKIAAPEEWAASLWRDVAAQFVVYDRTSLEWLGVTYAYNLNLRHGHVFMAAGKVTMHDRTRRFVDGIALFVDYRFRTWPLRKIYMQVPAYNMSQLSSSVGWLLMEEGRFSDHVWLDGRYWDLHILTLGLGKWTEARPAIMSLVGESAVVATDVE